MMSDMKPMREVLRLARLGDEVALFKIGLIIKELADCLPPDLAADIFEMVIDKFHEIGKRRSELN